jgi:hypothetical protein
MVIREPIEPEAGLTEEIRGPIPISSCFTGWGRVARFEKSTGLLFFPLTWT